MPRNIMEDKSMFIPPNLPYAVTKEIKAETVYFEVLDAFRKGFSKAYGEYAEKYSALNDLGVHDLSHVKVQRTEPGQGYHIWHCEQDDKVRAGRILTFILYLNDDFEAGETEFLYLQERVQPKQGRLVIFPGAYTHYHRGNPPLGSDKYIITGWVEF
jgi:hypothetical protein